MRPTLESIDQNVQEWLQDLPDRPKKLLAKILHEPTQVATSVLTHLGKDRFSWHNSLNHLARKKSKGMATWMILMGQVLRHDRQADLFGPRELSDIASKSMGTWLSGKHEDALTLRLRAAIVLGDMLDDPQRRPKAQAILEEIGAHPIPDPMDLSGNVEAAARARLEKEVGEFCRKAQEEGAEGNPIMQAMSDAVEGGLLPHYLDDGDYTAALRLVDLDDGPADLEKAIHEILGRLSTRIVNRAAFDVLKPTTKAAAAPRP